MSRKALLGVAAVAVVAAGAWMFWPTGKKDQAASDTKGAAASATTRAVDCPSSFTLAERPAGAPVDDVMGVRQGTKLNDAILFFQCRPGSRFVMKAEDRGIADPHGQKLRQVVDLADGTPRARPYDYAKAIRSGEVGTPDFQFVTEEVRLWSLGAMNEETVWGVWRSQYFKPEELPAAPPIVKQLVEKYGPPSYAHEEPRQVDLVWGYDAAGAKLDANSGAINFCRSQLDPRIDGRQDINEQCGLMIRARISKANANPLLAEDVRLVVLDHARYLHAVQDFERTTAGLQAGQRSDEAARAAATGPKPNF